MTMALAIVERSHRVTLEQQYAHVLWLVHSLHRQAPMTLLLRGPAVVYAVDAPIPGPLFLGGRPCGTIPDYREAIERLCTDGGSTLACATSLERFGLSQRPLIAGIKLVTDDEITMVAAACDFIWYL
jgi:hypothetical protein